MNIKYGPYLKWQYHYNKDEEVVLYLYTDNWKIGYDLTRLNEKAKKFVKLLEAVGMNVEFWYREDLSNGDVIIHWNITRGNNE